MRGVFDWGGEKVEEKTLAAVVLPAGLVRLRGKNGEENADAAPDPNPDPVPH